MKRALPHDLTSDEWKQIRSDFSDRCAMTKRSGSSMDHFIPLDTGHGGTVVGNCYPMNRPLNSSKHTSNPFEWIKRPDIAEQIDPDAWERLIAYLADQNGLTVNQFRSFVYWCFDNPRTVEEVKADGDITSVELWRKSVGAAA